MRAVSRRNDESGMALITVFMVLMLASALMVGFFATIVADQRANGIDRDQTQAYAAAHAGLEKLTSNLATLFAKDYSPSKAQIDAIVAKPPVIPGFVYTAPGGAAGSGYFVDYNGRTNLGAPNFGNPIPDTTTGTPITAGPYAGFKGIITKYPITVTARSTALGGAEVRLRRELQTVGVPVFQFGVFSETDLTFYAGDDFNFGGRVQTNGNLFLSELIGKTLTFSDRVTAYKEVVRANLSNGKSVTAADVRFDGIVRILDASGVEYRKLATNEGSVTGMPSSPGPPAVTQALNTNWTTISTANAPAGFKSLIRNGLTGAKFMSLPLVSQGALPIDLIRRPVPPEPPVIALEDATNTIVFNQRYFSMASLRILLSDTAAEIMSLPTIDPLVQPTPLDGTHTAAQYAAPSITPHRSPLAGSPGRATIPYAAGSTYTMRTNNNSTTSHVDLDAAIPAYFKIPTNIMVNGVNRTCTGRTPTSFTGCLPIPIATIPSGTAVTALVPKGNETPNGTASVPVTTTLAGAWTVALAGTMNVVSTAAFAPTSFWLHGVDGGAFTCTGYDTTPRLTGCTGLPSAPGTNTVISTGALETPTAAGTAGASLHRGFIKIELQTNANPPVWVDVTKEILELGISGPPNNGPTPICDPTPNAVIRLQHLRDIPPNPTPTVAPSAGGLCAVNANGNASINPNDYWPNVLYDTREGTYRDDPPAPPDPNPNVLALGGIMNYVALDVANLKKYFEGTVAPFNVAGMRGNQANNQSGAGFIVYFSDRRGNKCTAGPSCPGAPVGGVETGEYGAEDFVNPTRADGLPVDLPRVRDVGEDVNAYECAPGPPIKCPGSPFGWGVPTPAAGVNYTPVLDIYGQTPQNAIAYGTILDAAKSPWSQTTFQWAGMVNRPIFFRRALKLINGGNPTATTSNMPSPGLTVASENPVYVQGNYNATVGTVANGVEPTETHVAAAILADAVTLLSNNWNDSLSFQNPNAAALRPATSTAYRFAVVSGKSLSFPYPAAGTPQFLFGTDGGVGNFLRLLEDWRTGPQYVRYRGSIVSLFISRQATGTFKYSTRVYDYANRKFTFDDDFLLPTKLPPGTPMFRDVNTLTFRQLLRPNQ